jgi:inosine-uridine nucleoside N-ribohydrolase
MAALPPRFRPTRRGLLAGGALAVAGAIARLPVPAHAQEPAARRIIVSADLSTGLSGGWRGGVSDIDDGLAVLMALADPRLDLLGVGVTYGNNQTGPGMIAARTLLADLAGSGVPILRGAETRLSDPPALLLATPLPAASDNEFVRWMADELDRGPCTVLCLGPMTDVAALILTYPEAAAGIDRIVAIGGRAPGQTFEIGGKTGLTDFNVALDPRAAGIVAESGIPVSFLGFTLTSSTLIPRSALDPFRTDSSPLAQFVVRAADAWIDHWQGIFGEDGFHPWDQNAVHYASQPDDFTCAPVSAALVPCSSDPAAPDACHGSSLNAETAHLILTPASGDSTTLQCTGYASDEARSRFLSSVLAFLKRP